MKIKTKLSIISKSIKQLGKEFRISEKIILNEFDAQATLFNILRKKLKKSKELIHCQIKIEDVNNKPDLMIFENSKFDIKRSKNDQYSIEDWWGNILSVIEIKHLLEGSPKKVLDKIKQDFNKLKRAKMKDSYVILLHHSSTKDKNLINKIKDITKKDNKLSISVFYCNMKKSYLIKGGYIIN